MYRIPTDEEMFADLPGSGVWTEPLCATMAEQYDERKQKVLRDIQYFPPTRTATVEGTRNRAMGKWVMSYLRQRKPIQVYPTYRDTGEQLPDGPEEGPCMIPKVAEALSELEAARGRLEATHGKTVLKKAAELAVFLVMEKLCHMGILWYTRGTFPLFKASALGEMLGVVYGLVFVAGLIYATVGVLNAFAGLALLLLGLTSRHRVRYDFIDAVTEYVPYVYPYLRFCQLWSGAEGEPLPEELSSGLREVEESMALYNKVA